MPVRQRLAVGFLFGLGIIVTGAGIVRTWYIYRSLFNEYDQTWYSYPLWIAAAVEIDLGVVSCPIRHHPSIILMWVSDLRLITSPSTSVGIDTLQSVRHVFPYLYLRRRAQTSIKIVRTLVDTFSCDARAGVET